MGSVRTENILASTSSFGSIPVPIYQIGAVGANDLLCGFWAVSDDVIDVHSGPTLKKSTGDLSNLDGPDGTNNWATGDQLTVGGITAQGTWQASAGTYGFYVKTKLMSSDYTTAPGSSIASQMGGNVSTGYFQNIFAIIGARRAGKNAVVQIAKADNQTAGGTPAVTFGAAVKTGNLCVAMLVNLTRPPTVAAPTGWTRQEDTSYNTPAAGCDIYFRNSGETGTTITWGGTSATAFSVMAIELDMSDPGTDKPTPPAARFAVGGIGFAAPPLFIPPIVPSAVVATHISQTIDIPDNQSAATADALTPTPKVTVVAPLSTATADAFTPTVSAVSNITVTSPMATATADALTPTPKVTVPAPMATATADAFTPTPKVTVVAPMATATADAFTPTVTATANATVTAPMATATADALTPTPKVTLSPGICTATADALTPTVKGTLLPGISTATADAFTPTPKVTVVAPLSTATADAFTPTISAQADASISSPIATAVGVIPFLAYVDATELVFDTTDDDSYSVFGQGDEPQYSLIVITSSVSSGTPNIPTVTRTDAIFTEKYTATFDKMRITVIEADTTVPNNNLFTVDFGGQTQQEISVEQYKGGTQAFNSPSTLSLRFKGATSLSQAAATTFSFASPLQYSAGSYVMLATASRSLDNNNYAFDSDWEYWDADVGDTFVITHWEQPWDGFPSHKPGYVATAEANQTVAANILGVAIQVWTPDAVDIVIDDSVTAPIATATADAFTPTPKVTILPGLATATADAFTPTVTAVSNATVSAPIATATADAFTPTVTAVQNATVSAPIATATASALTPTVGPSLFPGISTATADAFTPTPKVTINAPISTATADAMEPDITAGGSRTISVPIATAVADAMTPVVTAAQNVTILVPMALATADALVPIPKVTLISIIPTATGQALVAAVLIDVSSPIATATAAAMAPTVSATADATVLAGIATAVAEALIPTVSGSAAHVGRIVATEYQKLRARVQDILTSSLRPNEASPSVGISDTPSHRIVTGESSAHVEVSDE